MRTSGVASSGGRVPSGRLVGWLVAGVLGVALVVLAAGPARAADFAVTSTDDSGSGSLRAAINEANGNDESDTITFDLPSNSTIVLTSGSLIIENDVAGLDVTIEGPGPDQLSVDGNDSFGVFTIRSAEANISGLRITGGSTDTGGGIFNDRGTLRLNNSTVEGNTAAGGGGIGNTGTMTVNNCTVDGNAAVILGGGIANLEGKLTLNKSTVSNNTAFSNGGGIYSFTTEVTNLDPEPSEKTIITNSTVSGNSTNSQGGGVSNFRGLTIIEYTTITDNTAPEFNGSGVQTSGDSSTRTEVGSSIIAANTSSDVDYRDFPPQNPFFSLGYNVIGDGEGEDAFDGPNDITGVDDPGLGPLANNGGPTQTHALQSGSPALNRVAQGECPPPNTDQRGVSRPQGPRCDSGSFEKEVSPPPPPADKANLSLSKKASKGRPTVGAKLTYTLRVKNNGPDRATRVKIVDTLPRGVKVLSTSKGCRKLSARTVRCNIARLADDRSVAKKIVVKVNRSGKLVNKARASSSVRDPNGRNNRARAVVRAKAKAAPRFKQISCRVKDPTVRLIQGKQVVVADRKPGANTACVIQGNQLALARALKNQNLGLVRQGGKQVRAAKGKVVKSGARKVVVRVPRDF
ncbi:MAG: choice-of-anchor Q domain-containing protein [Rubrobacteraceae bacterium]